MGEAERVTLSKAALVGTSRGDAAISTGTPVDNLVSRLKDETTEQRLLLSAGALSVFRRSGLLTRSVTELPGAAPEDTVPVCPPKAGEALRDMLIDGRLELLPEAFALLNRAGFRLPSSLLVDCLDLPDRTLQDAARQVLGERGRWLAGQRSMWHWAREAVPRSASEEELRRVWEEGRPDDRLIAIGRARALNPRLAREWIAATWSHETSDVRVAILSILARGLSPEDEAWLQTVTKDRTRAVRAEAAALLARLPQSAFVARVTARADAYLDWTRGGILAKVRAAVAAESALRVTPPEAFDPLWESEGMTAKPPKGIGERAHWLIQTLTFVDPNHWSRHFNTAPPALAGEAWKSDWGSAVMTGWSRAALLHDAKEWMVALWDAWLIVESLTDPHAEAVRRDMLIALLQRMPGDAAEARVMKALDDPAVAPLIDLEAAVDRFEAPWSDALGSHVLDAIEMLINAPAVSSPLAGQLGGLVRAAGPSLPASLLDRAIALGSQEAVTAANRVVREFDVFDQQLRLRQRLYQEIGT